MVISLVKKQQLKLGNTFYNKDSMFLLFNYLKIHPDEYITKYGNEKFLEYVNNEKKSFIIYKVNKHKDEIANNDLAYERYLKRSYPRYCINEFSNFAE